MHNTQPWIRSAVYDSLSILSPPFVCLAAVMVFGNYFTSNAEVSLMQWVMLVLCVDVAHVYSTLYRTYFHRDTVRMQRTTLILIPLFAWVAGVLVYNMDAMLFWRILAYIAVYHFIRQQYGFIRIYSRREQQPKRFQLLDNLAIYAATLYPMLDWHLGKKRAFHWFVENDFYTTEFVWLKNIFFGLYLLIAVAYVAKEMYLLVTQHYFNIPKNLMVAGTYIAWYVGIVVYNSDLVFTMFNVLSHGIPYMALVWAHQAKISTSRPVRLSASFFLQPRFIVIFVGILLGLAYMEESLWDSLVWRERESVFLFTSFLPQIQSHPVLSLVVPLLTVPQLTHYIIDGYIWKMKKDAFKWKEMLR